VVKIDSVINAVDRSGNLSGEVIMKSSGKELLTSNEVVERLGISKSTLYAYVSRGLIQSEPDPDSPRSRRYRSDDVNRLMNRQKMRIDPEHASSTALDWGSPVLESDISAISNQRLTYRGKDAVQLSGENSFEEVMALLWTGSLDADLPDPDGTTAYLRDELLRQSRPLAKSIDPTARLQMLLPSLEQHDPRSFDFRPEVVQQAGRGIIQIATACLTGTEGHSGVARTLQAHWSPGNSEASRLIDAALVLSADHELNISTFTVRCIASAKAPVYSAITGGVSAMRGQKHGGASLQAEALVDEVSSPASAYEVLRRRLQRGESLAGFGHRLYPDGDPRGTALLEMVKESRLDDGSSRELIEAIQSAADELQGVRPNLELALVALCRTLDLPAGSAQSLMTLGRLAGWIAHAIEEYERDQLIRPRARTQQDEAAVGR
jgi:citrate synthase